eukprot:2924286-Pyramimonas_sp.AAC.1
MGCGASKTVVDGIEARAGMLLEQEAATPPAPPHQRRLSHGKSGEAVLARNPTCKLGVTLEFLVTFLQDLDE